MNAELLPILTNPAVLERTSGATRRALDERAEPASTERFLAPELYSLLHQITSTLLPQESVGTEVDIAAAIDRRLLLGTNAGWRFADLPADGEAYARGLTVFAAMLQAADRKSFESMPLPERESYLRSMANGNFDGSAGFPLAKWLGMLRTDAVRFWMAHPSTMQKIEYFGFADGATGRTDGPTASEGWHDVTQNKALPFEQGIEMPAIITGREA